MKRYEAVIFDMDGVILDSEFIYLKSLQKCLYDLVGRNVSIDELSNVIGMNNNDITTYLLQYYSLQITFEELTNLQNIYFEKELVTDGIHEMEELSAFLECLKERKCKIALASSSDMKWIKRVIKELDIEKYFSIIVSGDDVEHSKPDPKIFNITVDRLCVDKCGILVLEDSRNGIMAANNAGLDVFAFCGSSVKQDTSGADYEVHSFAEMIQLFTEMYK